MISIVESTSPSISRVAELCFALAMRLIPRRYRFDAALSMAPALLPLLRHTKAYREQEIKKFHSPREIVLHLILNALTKNGTAFDPRIEITGFAHFVEAHARGKGVLVIGHHAALTLFMVRLFYNEGFAPVVITPDAGLRIGGTTVIARTVQPSALFLVKLRNKLRDGELVCGMPDRGEHHAGRTVEFSIPAGQVILAPAMIQVAARCGAEVFFTVVRSEGRRLVATIAAPSRSSLADAATLTEDFILFVREHSDNPTEGKDRRIAKSKSCQTTNHSNSLAKSAMAAPEVD